MANIDWSDVVLGNAAGTVKTEEEATALLRSAATRITVGSITVERRNGNFGVYYYYSHKRKSAWNALGIPNKGLAETLAWLPDFKRRCKDVGKELVVSIAGFSPEEYGMLAAQFAEHVDVIEINAGCGNLWGNGGQKAVPSYEPLLFREIVDRVCRNNVRHHARVGVKISPLAGDTKSADALEGLIRIVNLYGVDEVVACNTVINQRAKRDDSDHDVLAFREEMGATEKYTGGMSGELLRPTSVEVVKQLTAKLHRHTRVIGCGGIFTGMNLLEYLEAGAAGGEVATAYMEHRDPPKLFSELLQDVTA